MKQDFNFFIMWHEHHGISDHWPLHYLLKIKVIIVSDNGFTPVCHQTIIWINAGLLLIGPMEINFTETLIKNNIFHSRNLFKNGHSKMPAVIPRPWWDVAQLTAIWAIHMIALYSYGRQYYTAAHYLLLCGAILFVPLCPYKHPPLPSLCLPAIQAL